MLSAPLTEPMQNLSLSCEKAVDYQKAALTENAGALRLGVPLSCALTGGDPPKKSRRPTRSGESKSWSSEFGVFESKCVPNNGQFSLNLTHSTCHYQESCASAIIHDKTFSAKFDMILFLMP